jgi:hypothetical protein
MLLVSPEYVASSTGADITGDPARVEFLIGEAGSLICESLGRAYTPETVPVAVKQAIAILVNTALAADPGEGGATGGVKAEQIGDYRVEFATAGVYTSGLDLRQVAYLLDPLRAGARAVRTDVALDGVLSVARSSLRGCPVVNA